MSKSLQYAISSFLLLTTANANATILTFDGFDDTGTPPIQEDYGDRVTSTTDDGFDYGEAGEGFTPDVEVSYLPDDSTQQFDIWDGYGDLDNALGDDNFSVPGEIRFQPDADVAVSLNRFDIAAWTSDFTSPVSVQVLDEADNALFGFPGPTTADGHDTLEPSVTSNFGEALFLRVEDFGDQAVDNISFSQQTGQEPAPVPAPAPLTLFGFGLLFLVFARLRLGPFARCN